MTSRLSSSVWHLHGDNDSMVLSKYLHKSKVNGTVCIIASITCFMITVGCLKFGEVLTPDLIGPREPADADRGMMEPKCIYSDSLPNLICMRRAGY